MRKHEMRNQMTFSEFTAIVENQPDGVVLLEGRRDIPDNDYILATCLARNLAITFPDLRFRSGNATGSDQAFSDGIASVDASRLQIIAPYASHRKKNRYPDAIYDSPDSLSTVQEEQIVYKTINATPKNKGLIDLRNRQGALAVKAAYLIRDTMKVIGHSSGFSKPICAVFYVNPEDPMTGGTGHTIRVCKQEGVPVVFQNSWQSWI